ncbi:MAG: Glycosyl transferase group 1 [Microgenomates group bacterium GW2011_GWA1_48_10]|nr:MAG: Glycosyl transferase group 1 [Microgenomates group bacterium GW2011_GWA1_48_10]
MPISRKRPQSQFNLYAVSPDKVVVTYPGYDSKRFKPVAKNKRSRLVGKLNKYKIEDQKYFLFLGTLQPRKNLTRLIEAFATLGNNNLKLVIVGMNTEGRGGWMQQPIFDKVNQLGLSKKVIFTGFIPDADVPILMAGSKAFVLPSLYEGFGIPPIEAMATGVPVVVSKVSSLPEICGLAATYIDNPYEVGSIQQALQEVLLQTPSQRARKVRLGMEWVKRYNWDNTAKKTLQVLYDAAQR